MPFHYIVYDYAKVMESSLFFLKEYLSKMMGNRYLIGYKYVFKYVKCNCCFYSRLNHVAAGLVSPSLKSDTSSKEIEEAMKRVREAQSLISAAIEPGKTDLCSYVWKYFE